MSTRGSDGRVDGPGWSGRKVRQVSGPQVDGGTEFVLHAPPSGWHAAFRRIVIQLRRPALQAQRDPFADVSAIVVRLRSPSGREFEFTALARGRGARYVSLTCAGEVAIAIDIARERVKLRVSKERAWDRRGFLGWAADWFDTASFWLLGRRCPSPAKAAALGWRTHGLELCADFTGLKFSLRDAKCFTGRARTKTIQTSGFDARFGETIQIGQRRRNTLSLDTHNKSKQVREKHRVEPEDSLYAPTWRGNGWRDGEVRRVEIHARGSALCLAAKGEGDGLDLTDPGELLEPASLGRLWRHATTRYRLVAGPRGRKRSKALDPRWRAVQAAGGDDMQENLVKREQPRRRAPCRRSIEPVRLDRTARAAACLVRLLGEGELPADEVKRAARQAGFSSGTIRRAKVLLRIRSRKAGRGSWMWSTRWACHAATSTAERPAWLFAGPSDEEALDDGLVETARKQFSNFVAALVDTGLVANDAKHVAWMLLVVRR